MTSFTTRCALLAGLGFAAMTLPALAAGTTTITDNQRAVPKVMHLAANPYDCFTDDGYGRRRPCSANFKKTSSSSKKMKTKQTSK
jgi:hypothetical protein